MRTSEGLLTDVRLSNTTRFRTRAGIHLTPELIKGFTIKYLLSQYDDPQPIPAFHEDLWDICTRNSKYIAIAAPRGFAKTTAVTHTLSLACALFQLKRNIVIISETLPLSKLLLGNIKKELQENDQLIKDFEITGFVKDTETEIIVQVGSGKTATKFRIAAKGSGASVRGMSWLSMRPDLIICDDMEDDEMVFNADRREKYRHWFLNALVPATSVSGHIRVVGTILHFDSLLERLLNNEKWNSARFAAHDLNWQEFLWGDYKGKEFLSDLYGMYVSDGNPDGYFQEMLNIPMSPSNSYFKGRDFLPITKPEESLTYYVGVDLAISQKTRADYSAFVVAGLNSTGILKVVDVIRGRMDGPEILETIFELQQRYNPDLFFIESDKIAKSLGGILSVMQNERGIYIGLPDTPINPSADKAQRARPIQARMRQGMIQFDMGSEWFPMMQEEMIRFLKGKNDDMVDGLSMIGLGLARLSPAATAEETEYEKYQDEKREAIEYDGRSSICGY